MAGRRLGQNFIDYNSLSREGQLFFAHSGLNRFIEIAAKLLKKRIGPPNIHDNNRSYFSDKDWRIINILIRDLLRVIIKNGRRSGLKTKDLHSRFQKRLQRNDFPVELHIARFEQMKRQLLKNPLHAKIISDNSSLPESAFSKKLFNGISTAHKITFGRYKLTETETRALGTFYMIGLLWETAQETRECLRSKECESVNLPFIFHSMMRLFSILDESDRLIAHSDGGKRGNKKSEFVEAAAIVEKIVQADPEVDTSILSERAFERITGELDTEDHPSLRWVTRKVQQIKKIRRGK